MYKLQTLSDGTPCVVKQEGKILINLSQQSEYREEYLKWLDKGNTPEPADTPPAE